MSAAAGRSLFGATCSRKGSTGFSLHLSARGNGTLDQLLPRSLRTGLVAGGADTQATLRWNRSGASSSGSRALSGHYAGPTSDGKTIGFQVAADAKSIVRFDLQASVGCSDGSHWSFTFSSGGKTPIQANLGFAHTYSGPLSGNAGVANLRIAYVLRGKLDGSGGASGTLYVSSVSWDSAGKHYACTGAQATWTAKRGG